MCTHTSVFQEILHKLYLRSGVLADQIVDGWRIYCEYFLLSLQENNIKFPVLLLLDGHKSHINMDLYHFCIQKRIILYCLLLNATRILQPCDVSVFKSLKGHWKKTILKHILQLQKNTFALLFQKAFEESIKPEIIKNDFRKCGLFTFSADTSNAFQQGNSCST